MKRKIKLSIIILFSVLFSFNLTGCWSSREINTLAFATSMGFDKTDKGILMTVQVLNPHAIAAQKTVNEASIIVYTQEGQDVFEMIRRTITKSSRKLNVTHLQTIVFGEDFAKDGISDVLDFLTREHQSRTDMYFSVAKGTTAHNVLTSLTKLDVIPSVKFYSSMRTSDEIWAGNKSVKILDLINSIISDGKNSVLSGMKLKDDHQKEDTIEELKKTESDPIIISDLAVLKKDKFIGWLNEDESKGYNYILGEVQSSVGFVEDQKMGKITFEITGTESKQKISFKDGKPSVCVEINIKANIETVSKNVTDLTKEETLQKIEKLSSEKITNHCNKSLQKAQKELKSDIFGFGENIHKSNPKQWNTLKGDWDKEFSKVPVKIDVNFKIEKSGTIYNSYFKKDEK